MRVYRSLHSYRSLGVRRQTYELITYDSAMDLHQQGNGNPPSLLDPESLRSSAGWIRDELDPIVAREGPSSLEPDDVVTVHNLLDSIKALPHASNYPLFSNPPGNTGNLRQGDEMADQACGRG